MKMFKKILENTLVGMAWIQMTIAFVVSLWSVQGEYGMAAIAFVIMLFLLIDDCRKYGTKRIFSMQMYDSFGLNYYKYRAVTLVISFIVNIGAYIALFFAK